MKIVVVENPRPLTVEHYNDVANAPLSASLNSGYACAVARRVGWEVTYLDFTATTLSVADVATHILAEAADIVLLHWVYSWGHEAFVGTVLEQLRRESPVAVGACGFFPTLSGQRLLGYVPQLDFLLSGEFEQTLAELLVAFAQRQVLAPLPGVLLRDQHLVPRPLLQHIGQLPVPDDLGANCTYPSLNIAASRGCYGTCSFCFIQRYYGCSLRRVRDLDSLEHEVAVRTARREIRSLYFIDPTFIGHGHVERERIVALAQLAKRFQLPFGFETRVGSFDEELMATLVAHGATSVFLGIESGCDAVLGRIGKGISTEQIRTALQIVRACGIELNLGFIMFEPDTTLAELAENYAFLDDQGLLTEHTLTANLLYHNQIVLYGSAAWEQYRREGRLLLDEQLPFEARYRFRDERVGLVCTAMGRITSHYFRGMERVRNNCAATVAVAGVPLSDQHGAQAINSLLKDAFSALCRAAATEAPQHVEQLADGYVGVLQGLCADL
jgi:hypothetical protein